MTFATLGIPQNLLRALDAVGYEVPTPIQARTIPLLLEGRDVVGQAQTGTGKTAAFAIPALAKVDPKLRAPQVLVLAPTRELALQVAEAFQKYAVDLPGFHVLPVYGGQAYPVQLRALARGPQVIVGTPGRLMDHMRSGALSLEHIRLIVLDEADEMLRMGFIDDVTWILEQLPAQHQTALFSATMPPPIRRIAQKHLNNPAEATIAAKTSTATTIRQRFWLVSGVHKLDALTRVLEVEDYDGMIIFVRTKTETVELAEKLEARGHACSPLNGDMPQALRERTVERLKGGDLDVLIATDVAARGLDVERISHVVNFDVPNDPEAYVHRIGRTGRAGRSGEAILFVAPRERGLLRAIERAIGRPIEQMALPTAKEVNATRIARFRQGITDVLAEADLAQYRDVLNAFIAESGADPLDVAAALAHLAQGEQPLLMPEVVEPPPRPERTFEREPRGGDDYRPHRDPGGAATERYRMEVGARHGLRPAQVVASIARIGGIPGRAIGNIEIYDEFAFVDLPAGMPPAIFRELNTIRIDRREIRLSRVGPADSGPPQRTPRGPRR